jgi:hypothetical protein
LKAKNSIDQSVIDAKQSYLNNYRTKKMQGSIINNNNKESILDKYKDLTPEKEFRTADNKIFD